VLQFISYEVMKKAVASCAPSIVLSLPDFHSFITAKVKELHVLANWCDPLPIN